MDLLELLVLHAAEGGPHELAGLLEAEGDVDLLQLRVLREEVHEPAHDVGLLRLGEALKAAVHAHQDDLRLLREEEVHAQVEPGLRHGEEPGLPVPDQHDVAVVHRLVLLDGVLHFQQVLLHQQCRELVPLDQPCLGLRELLLACIARAVFHGYEELEVAGIEEVVLRELHRLLDVVAGEVLQVAEAVHVPLAVRRGEVGPHRLAVLVNLRRLLRALIGELVQVLDQRSDMAVGL